MAYQLLSSGGVQRADGAVIPDDPHNADWQAFQAWKAAGNTPAPVPVPAVQIPSEVSMRQARLALNAIDKLAAVDAVIAAMPEPQKTDARIEWEYSSAVQRDKPLVQQLGIALELDAAALDQLFLTAATL